MPGSRLCRGRSSSSEPMLRKVLAALCGMLVLCSCAKPQALREQPAHAVWYAYLDYEEAGTTDRASFEASVDETIHNLQAIGVNTVFLHTVVRTEAYYPSKIYPMAQVFNGIDYDPLAIFIDRAHGAGIQVEAWVDPLRSLTVDEVNSREINDTVSRWLTENNERLRQVNGRWYLNPGYPEVRELVCSVVQEILDNYAVDGVHLDDYFYPDGTDRRFDAYAFGHQSEHDDVSAFRKASVDSLVEDLHALCAKKGVRFGISTAGNYELTSETYYADPAHWVQAGTVDYLAPQIYWGFEHPLKPFTETLEQWQAIAGDVPLMPGLAAYKAGTRDIYAQDGAEEWLQNHDILVRQIRTAEEHGCAGWALFRYGSLFRCSEDVRDAVKLETAELILHAHRTEEAE